MSCIAAVRLGKDNDTGLRMPAGRMGEGRTRNRPREITLRSLVPLADMRIQFRLLAGAVGIQPISESFDQSPETGLPPEPDESVASGAASTHQTKILAERENQLAFCDADVRGRAL